MDLIFIIVAMAITGVMAIMAAIPVIALTALMPTLMTINQCDGLIIYECCNLSYIMNNC